MPKRTKSYRVDSVERARVVKRARNKSTYFWRDAEDRYISQHRTDGYVLISEGLKGMGYYRSPEAVRMHAYRCLKFPLSKYPEHGVRKCAECGCYDARPGTVAGRAGFCPTCWTKRKAQAMREGRSERAAESEYQREKKKRRKRGE